MGIDRVLFVGRKAEGSLDSRHISRGERPKVVFPTFFDQRISYTTQVAGSTVDDRTGEQNDKGGVVHLQGLLGSMSARYVGEGDVLQGIDFFQHCGGLG